jgi:hypothetical protein
MMLAEVAGLGSLGYRTACKATLTARALFSKALTVVKGRAEAALFFDNRKQ